MLKFGSKNDIPAVYKCTVRLLDDTEVIQCEFQAHHKGSYLLEHVCKQLNLLEKDYFGLRYVDSSRQRHWLDLGKTVLKQVKEMDPVLFSFRVKFYPPDPFKLKEEITRYQIYLQLKRDLLHGRLYCTQTEAAVLGAYIVQGELGDFDAEEHSGNYVADLKLLLKQTQPIEEKIMELHQIQLKDQSPADMETLFLKKACQLDTYGVDPHPVKDHRGNTLYLGVNHLGILTFQGSRKTHHFQWSEVQKINYEGKMFIIHLIYHEKKHTVGFKCPTGAACRHVWRCSIEQMLFFTLPKSTDAPVVSGGGLFSWGTKFRYSGRTEREVLEDDGSVRDEPSVRRVSSLRRKASSVPATPSTPLGSDLGYSSLPRSNHSVPDSRLEGGRSLLLGPDTPVTPHYSPESTLLDPVSEDQETSGRLRQQAVESASVAEVRDNEYTDPKIIVERLRNGQADRHRAPGLKEMDSLDDYYFRDSFDHSSSESQLQDRMVGGVSHRSSRSQTPQPPPRLRSGSRSSLQTVPAGTVVPAPPPLSVTAPLAPNKRFSLLRVSFPQDKNPAIGIKTKVFIPSFLIVAITLLVATIFIFESESDFVSSIQRVPEMVALRREFYEPTKESIAKRLRGLWPR